MTASAVKTNAEFGALISYTRPFPSVSFLTFLEAMPIAPRIYWESGNVEIEFAGGGAAAELYAGSGDRFAELQGKLDELFSEIVIDSTAPSEIVPRVFGGFSFRDDFIPSGVWTAFPTAYFVLPRYQITRARETGETWLTINRRSMPFEHSESALDSLVWEFESVVRRVEQFAEQPERERQTVCIERCEYPLTREHWREQITDATRCMKAGEFEKVVLARTLDLRLTEPPNLLAALERMGTRYPHTYRFLIEPGAGRAFFGASPELLAEVKGDQLRTAALAGSRKRGGTPAEDSALAAELFNSPKERYEHGVVVAYLREKLSRSTTDLNVPSEPTILKLTNIQHLYSPVRGKLTNGKGILSVVRDLHPTPAMGGSPQNIGMEMIKQIEIMPRGWFAAPIGWIDGRGNGMFAAAIRSAVGNGTQVRLYAGAGIVADSDPDQEWQEIEIKFQPMMEALGVQQ
jgi:menaquinone-specific isochorismate synthase